jgi:hypothetical protein
MDIPHLFKRRMRKRKGKMKKNRRWAWTRPMKRNERSSKLRVGDLA